MVSAWQEFFCLFCKVVTYGHIVWTGRTRKQNLLPARIGWELHLTTCTMVTTCTESRNLAKRGTRFGIFAANSRKALDNSGNCAWPRSLQLTSIMSIHVPHCSTLFHHSHRCPLFQLCSRSAFAGSWHVWSFVLLLFGMVQGWAAEDVQIFCFESRIWWMMLRKLAKAWCRLAEFHWQLARAK